MGITNGTAIRLRDKAWLKWSLLFSSLVLALALFFTLSASSTYVSDDTFIAFRYAKNFARYGQLTWNPGVEMCDGFTSTFHVIYLSFWAALGADLVTVQMITDISCAVLVFLLLGVMTERVLRLPVPATMLAFAMLALHRPTSWYVTAGFETLLYTTLVGITSIALVRSVQAGNRRVPLWVYFMLFLLNTARPEALLFATACACALAYDGVRNGVHWKTAGIRLALAYFAPLTVYLATKTYFYGYPVPNTYFAKATGGRLGKLLNGLEYLWLSAAGGGALLLAAFFLVPFCARERRPLSYLGLFCGLFTCAILVSGGDNHLMARFFVPIVPLLIATAVAVAFLAHGPWRACGWLIIAAFVLTQVMVGGELKIHFGNKLQAENQLTLRLKKGVSNLSSGAWPVVGHNAWRGRRDPAEFLSAALPTTATVAQADVGELGYYLDRTLYDMYGLNDREIAHSTSEFGRWHTYGKYSPRLVFMRKPDVFLADVRATGKPLPFGPTGYEAIKNSFFQSEEFKKEYLPVSLKLPAMPSYLALLVRKDSPVISETRTDYWSITGFLKEFYSDRFKYYTRLASLNTVFAAQLAQLGDAQPALSPETDVAILTREEVKTLRPMLSGFQLVPYLRLFRNDWLQVYINSRRLTPGRFSRNSAGRHFALC